MKLDMFTLVIVKIGLLVQLQNAEALKQKEIEQGEVVETIGKYQAGMVDGLNCAIAVIEDLYKDA